MFDILHIVDNSPITLLKTDKILALDHDPSRKGKANVCSRVVLTTREVVEVEINCARMVEMDLTIALRSNWSCLSKRIWSRFGEGDTASGRVIIAGGHDFELSRKPSKSYSNRRDVNWSYHTE